MRCVRGWWSGFLEFWLQPPDTPPVVVVGSSIYFSRTSWGALGLSKKPGPKVQGWPDSPLGCLLLCRAVQVLMCSCE